MAFTATTGLRPFNLVRSCMTMALIIATLVIAKFIDGYVFCGFNENFHVDLPIGIALLSGCLVCSSLGLAINRKPTTKCGRCFRTFAGTTIGAWLFLTCCASLLLAVFTPILGRDRDLDTFNICGNRTIDAVKAQFSNLAPIFELIQRIDYALKLVLALAWLIPVVFVCAIFGAYLPDKEDRLRREVLENGNCASERKYTYLEHLLLNGGRHTLRLMLSKGSDQPAAVDIDDESAPSDAIPEAGEPKANGSEEMAMEEGTMPSLDDSNEAKPQFDKVLPEFSIVDEEEATATKEGRK